MTDEPQPPGDDEADGGSAQPENFDPERGQRIKRARDALHLTQREVAQRVGVDPASGRVSKWEKGETVRPGNLVKLAEVLGVPVAHIEYGADRAAPSEPDDLQKLASQVEQLRREVKQLRLAQKATSEAEVLQRNDPSPPPTPDPPDEPHQ